MGPYMIYKLMHAYARVLKAHSHSMSGGSIWASFECHCCFWIAGGLVSYLTMWLLTLQLFKNSIDTREKLRLNLHSLSVSELLEYWRKSSTFDTNVFYDHVFFCVCVLVICTQMNMFLTLLWVYIQNGNAEKLAWSRWESNPRLLG